eukprot:TRINITY_DN80011_c0_g1_i1.p1 TRINITY_DN80011_c0_g1~~TRINITY_DN80011_c0_g1_i1.p1  ORF type:complete len:175 (+),score=42.96 TRINITY_DN80011_c0_g1_i1:101-625(+)
MPAMAMAADHGFQSFLMRRPAAANMATSFANPTTASYGGLMSQGYVPPGQFEDLLNLIRQASAASERAMNAAKYAEMAASAAGAAGQQAVVRAMHMANAPGAPTAAPFSPGSPAPGQGIEVSSMPLDPSLLATAFSAAGAAAARAEHRPRRNSARFDRGVGSFLADVNVVDCEF